MPRNIEIKAKIESIEALTTAVAAIADQGPIASNQDDTFFDCPNGRLKLRERSPRDGEVIFYQRPDTAGPKESFYVIARTSTPAVMREVLARAYGEAGRVRKRRTLFLVGRARIHLDRVEGLGDFLELGVVLTESESPHAGRREALRLLAQLGIHPSQLQSSAYVDLLAAKQH